MTSNRSLQSLYGWKVWCWITVLFVSYSPIYANSTEGELVYQPELNSPVFSILDLTNKKSLIGVNGGFIESGIVDRNHDLPIDTMFDFRVKSVFSYDVLLSIKLRPDLVIGSTFGYQNSKSVTNYQQNLTSFTIDVDRSRQSTGAFLAYEIRQGFSLGVTWDRILSVQNFRISALEQAANESKASIDVLKWLLKMQFHQIETRLSIRPQGRVIESTISQLVPQEYRFEILWQGPESILGGRLNYIELGRINEDESNFLSYFMFYEFALNKLKLGGELGYTPAHYKNDESLTSSNIETAEIAVHFSQQIFESWRLLGGVRWYQSPKIKGIDRFARKYEVEYQIFDISLGLEYLFLSSSSGT